VSWWFRKELEVSPARGTHASLQLDGINYRANVWLNGERIAGSDEVVGVNARNLETLDVDVDRALTHLARIPAARISVMESGIATRAHVRAAVDAGASAILVGEVLMRADDPGAKLRELLGEES